MLASGKLATDVISKSRLGQQCVLGFEYSGIESTGRRIMGMVECRALSNLCVGDPYLSWEIPENWTLEDAATVPCVYGTCYYALYQIGMLDIKSVKK